MISTFSCIAGHSWCSRPCISSYFFKVNKFAWRALFHIHMVKTHKLLQTCKQVVTSLFTRCIRPACSEFVGTSLEQAVDKLYELDGTIRPVTRLFQQD